MPTTYPPGHPKCTSHIPDKEGLQRYLNSVTTGCNSIHTSRRSRTEDTSPTDIICRHPRGSNRSLVKHIIINSMQNIIYTSLCSWEHDQKVSTFCSSFGVDSCYSDIVGLEFTGQCQSEVRAAAANGYCIHWASRFHCWFVLNLIVDGSIRVEWGKPVQFNSTPTWFPSCGQHAWCGGRWGTINTYIGMQLW